MKIISRRRPRSIRCSYSSNADEESCLPLVAVLEDQTCNGNSSSHSVNRDDASSASVRYSSSASHRSTSSSFRRSPQQRWLLLTTVLLTLLLSTTEVALSFSVVPSLHSLPVTGYCRRRQQEKEKEESSDSSSSSSSSSCGAKTTCSSSRSTFLQPYYAARQRQQQRAGATQLQAVAIAKSPSTGGGISDPVSISRSSHDHHHHHLQQQQQLMKEHLDQQQQQLNRQQQQQKRRTPCTTTTTTTTSKHTANTKQQLHSTASSSLSTSSSSCPVAEAWARKYTSVDALRETFGGNKNPLWGDLDAASARKLYKTLLPKALLELHQYYTRQLETTSTATTKGEHDKSSSSSTGSTTTSTAAASSVVATDLAPLAYQARVAAKLYTRERCRLPVRVAANLYDGFRQWRKTGKFNMHGMSYQQVWDKYANDIMAVENADQLSQEELAAKIGLKILERACVTNPVIDRLVLRNDDNSKKKQRHANHQDKKAPLSTAELQQITAQLEEDVERLLWPAVEEWEQSHHGTATTATTASTATSSRGQGTTRRRSTSLPPTTSTTTAPTANRYRTLRQLALMKRNLSRLKPPPAESSSSTTTTTTTTTSTPASSKHDHPWQERTHSFIPDRRPRVWQDRPRPQRQH